MSRATRWALALAAALAVLYLLFFWIFPWVEENLYTPTLGSSPPAADVGGQPV